MDGTQTTDPNAHLLGAKNVRLRDRILLSPYTKFLLPSVAVAFVAPVVVYALMISPYILDSAYSLTTCNLREEFYVDCLPGKNSTRSDCAAALCCWNDALGVCYHTVPSRHGYTPIDGVYSSGVPLVPRETNSPLGSPNVREIHVDISSADVNHVEISVSTGSQVSKRRRRSFGEFLHPTGSKTHSDFGQEDEASKRLLYFLPRDGRRRTVEIELDGLTNLDAYVHYPEFSVTVVRSKNSTTDKADPILSTARGPLILTETYWEWTLHLTNGSLYGLNDLEVNGTVSRVYNNENGSVTPAFLAVSPTGEGSAYYVDYKGPLEVEVLNVSNLVILRGMSLPDELVVHVFAGPTPLEAVQQLTLALHPIPKAFSYGLHVCPAGNFTSVEESAAELKGTIRSMEALDAPWDSHCLHERLASTLNRFLTAEDLGYVIEAKNELEETGRNFSPHLSPMVTADEGSLHSGLEEAALLLANGSTSHLGLYQDSSVVYPDWDNAGVKTMATSYLADYINDTGAPESVWIRDAWPKDETNSSSESGADFSRFDYLPDDLEHAMSSLTVPYDLATTSGALHYETHNSYSEGFRAFVRSSIATVEFLGPPGEGGNTSWSGLRRAVRSAVGAGIVGQLPPPIYVCGTGDFDASIHEELCMRWYQAAVPFPHVIVTPDRLPGGTHLSTSASLTAARSLRLRATLATYQRTLTASFFTRGSPLLAPTSLYYPEDGHFAHTSDQFMWGESILVALVTLPGVSQVPIRLPGNVSWRHLKGGSEAAPITNETTPVTANLGELITLVRPGRLIAIHKEAGGSTAETMKRNLTLAANLNCEEDEADQADGCVASGEIYFGRESGDFLNILVNRTHLILGNLESVKRYACDDSRVLQATFIETVQLLGSSSHKVNAELCDLEENNVAVSLA